MAVLSKPFEPLPPTFFNRDRQSLTRFQEQRIRRTFHFLDLPPELRNIIYELCFNFSGVETYFQRHFERVKAHARRGRDATGIVPRKANIKTPSIFLICRKVYAEAVYMLSKKEVKFHHGLLGLEGVHQVVSIPVLKRLSSITITTQGHPIFKKNMITASWRGYMDLITHLSMILSDGHNLKNLTINLDDPDLVVHMTRCWHDDDIKCDFRNHIIEAFNNLRQVRGVGCVNIRGIPAAFARELKARMESKPKKFLDLPGEIRNQIYDLAADYSDMSVQLARTIKNWVNHDKPPAYPARSTPTILLLNKKIHAEAASVLATKPLVLNLPLDANLKRQSEVPNFMRLITRRTLQKVQHFHLTIESWEWIYALNAVLPMLSQKHSLKTFHFDFKDCLKANFLAHPGKKYPDGTLHESLSGLTNVRGVGKVTVEGDLPEVYSKPLALIMQSPKEAQDLPLLRAIRRDGTVVEVEGGNEGH